MNTTLRRLSSVVMVMFLALMVSTTYVQYWRADRLNNDGRNVRSIFREFNNARGPIVVAGQPIAESVPVDTPFGFQRVYSGGDPEKAQMYAPVTGFFSLVNGSSAIESAENSFLNGQADALWINRLQDMLTGRKTQGSSVELTIDPAIQQAAWDALDGQRGSIVAVDPKTGAILAMVSKPSFDPNVLAVHSTGQAGQAFQDLVNADGNPMINRAIAALYPPGSTFKLIGAAAAIESGKHQADSQIPAPHRYTLPGTRTELRNFGDEICSRSNQMSIHDAMVMSCNTAFAALAVDLGGDAMRAQAAKFGFDDVFRVPMRSAVSAFPSAGDKFTPDRVALSGIGQGDVTSTPLQMAMVSAAIANHGALMEPHLVQTIRDPELEVVEQTEPNKLRDAISPSTADALKQMMVDTVRSGTGTGAQISGVQVAGKTGTAQTAPGVAPHAWFTAFAPADDPQIAVAVIVENGGNMASEATGGRLAAPMARSVIQAALNR
ncbi:peptidoglycan D,D-transpeptidase FtsI family protein [Xylanimonas sp. McL0601]|uniref:peptidoglycan D,D-transpeptidase FtsI family protein n=1 Tax=Xylanimonas sp. McL0601 TaxID=3414739 RepID=UPI003CF37171